MDLGRERWIREIAGSGLRSDILLQNIQKREFPNFRTTHLRICWYQENQNGNVVIGQDLFPSRVVIPPGAKVVVMHRTYGVRPYGNLVYCEARPTVTKPLDEPDEDEPKPDAFDPSPPRCPPPPPSPPRRPPQPRCPRLPPPLQCALPKTRPAKRSATKVHGGLFKKCEHPDCAFLVHSNPFIGSGRYCCEKCEGLHQGAEWAQTKGNRHYKNCERLEAPLHAGGVSPSRPESGEFERGVHVST